MRKIRQLPLTQKLYATYLLATAISLFIAYKDIGSDGAFYFLMMYLFFTFFMLLYIPVIFIKNLFNYKWADIRKSTVRFIILFILIGTLNYSLTYFFRPGSIDLVRTLSISFGCSFGLAFFDFIFYRKKQKGKVRF